jgi:ornithine racemase
MIWGLGTNARCLSATPPSCSSLEMLVELRDSLEEEYQIKIPVVSGGNSSLWSLIASKQIPSGINQVRIGEAIFIGNETSCYRKIDDAYTDAFTLEAEVIEVKKRSQGIRRAILALGSADVYYKNLTPKSFTCDIISQSSDHSVLSFQDENQSVAVGSIIKFGLNYFGVLSCMLSPYVEKTYIEK